MKHLFIICALFICASTFSQTLRLDTNEILNIVYPKTGDIKASGELYWSKNENGDIREYRTSVQNIFYYKIGKVEKATAVITSYDYTNGVKESCHGCTPILDVIVFKLKNSKWVKVKIKKGWDIPQPGFGEGAVFQLKKLNKINCLYSFFNTSYNGRGEYEVTTYYNIETLKEVKSISKKISD